MAKLPALRELAESKDVSPRLHLLEVAGVHANGARCLLSLGKVTRLLTQGKAIPFPSNVVSHVCYWIGCGATTSGRQPEYGGLFKTQQQHRAE